MKKYISEIMTNKLNLLVILFSMLLYYLFAYHTVRTNFYQVLFLYSTLFLLFLYLCKSQISTNGLIYIGLFLRLVFIFSIPNLSDDFYRFLWDGRAVFNGINPYLILPKNNPELLKEGVHLYEGMGSMNGSHYTCYPPLNQIAFTIPAIFSDSNLLLSTIVMRLTLILSDLVTVLFGLRILKVLKLNSKRILLYFINPFVIIELTGNLHFEGMMLALVSAALYYLIKNRYFVSAFYFGLAVSIKLVPLIFLPLLIKKIGFKKSVIYGTVVILVNAILFIPFASWELYNNFMSSIELYFNNFEFNASIYYIIREIGYKVKGYNIIQSVGKITPLIVIFITMIISLVRNNQKNKVLISSMIFTIVFYYLLSSIVHPWYIAVPLFLCVFTHYKFPIVWSFTIILSYSAYIDPNYHENLYLVGLEYTITIGYLIYELLRNSKLNSNKSQQFDT
ncbi:glycosyltransferase 87 family protein [Wenyingzhuangia sp. IMCC45533]